jgi:hypothetical protein
VNWLFRLWSSLDWNGQRRDAPAKVPEAGRWFPAVEPEALDAVEQARLDKERRMVIYAYSALVVFGWTAPDAVYATGWARQFVQAMSAVTPQISNIQGISGVRAGQNQFLFAVLWALAVPFSVAYVLVQDPRRWKLPRMRDRPKQFVMAIGSVALVFLVAHWLVFTEFEFGSSRVTYLLVGRVSAALAAPFFVFGALTPALFFANYLVRLAAANLASHPLAIARRAAVRERP